MPDDIKKIIESAEKAALLKEATQMHQHQHDEKRIRRFEAQNQDKAEADALWGKVREESQRLRAGQKGYDTFVTAMMDLFCVIELFNKALHKDKDVYYERLMMKFSSDSSLHKKINQATKENEAMTIDPEKLPALLHNIALKDDHTLDLDAMESSLKLSDTTRTLTSTQKSAIKECLQRAVIEWFGCIGYNQVMGADGAPTGTFQPSDGHLLTKAAFEARKQDLDEHLANRFGIKVRHFPSP